MSAIRLKKYVCQLVVVSRNTETKFFPYDFLGKVTASLFFSLKLFFFYRMLVISESGSHFYNEKSKAFPASKLAETLFIFSTLKSLAIHSSC